MYYKISIPRWQIYCFSLLLTPPNSYSWIAWCLLFSFLYIVTTPLWQFMQIEVLHWKCTILAWYEIVSNETRLDLSFLCRSFPNLYSRTTKQEKEKSTTKVTIQYNWKAQTNELCCSSFRYLVKTEMLNKHPSREEESHDGRVWQPELRLRYFAGYVCLFYFLVGNGSKLLCILCAALHVKPHAVCGLLEKVSLDELRGIFITYHITMSNTKVYRFSASSSILMSGESKSLSVKR